MARFGRFGRRRTDSAAHEPDPWLDDPVPDGPSVPAPRDGRSDPAPATRSASPAVWGPRSRRDGPADADAFGPFDGPDSGDASGSRDPRDRAGPWDRYDERDGYAPRGDNDEARSVDEQDGFGTRGRTARRHRFDTPDRFGARSRFDAGDRYPGTGTFDAPDGFEAPDGFDGDPVTDPFGFPPVPPVLGARPDPVPTWAAWVPAAPDIRRRDEARTTSAGDSPVTRRTPTDVSGAAVPAPTTGGAVLPGPASGGAVLPAPTTGGAVLPGPASGGTVPPTPAVEDAVPPTATGGVAGPCPASGAGGAPVAAGVPGAPGASGSIPSVPPLGGGRSPEPSSVEPGGLPTPARTSDAGADAAAPHVTGAQTGSHTAISRESAAAPETAASPDAAPTPQRAATRQTAATRQAAAPREPAASGRTTRTGVGALVVPPPPEPVTSGRPTPDHTPQAAVATTPATTGADAAPEPGPDPAEAAALAGAFAADYLSWDEDDPARRGRALSDHLPGPVADRALLGWSGQGRQRAEIVLPGAVREDGPGRLLVDVRVRVTPYRRVSRSDAAPEPDPGEALGTVAAAPPVTARGWRGLAARWVRLMVTVVREGDRLVVDAEEETVGEQAAVGRERMPTRPRTIAEDPTLDGDETAVPAGGRR